jgi:hypothetical protein
MNILTDAECYAIIAEDSDPDRRVKAARLLVLKANIEAAELRKAEAERRMAEIEGVTP